MNYQTERTILEAALNYASGFMVKAFSEAQSELQDFQQAHCLSDAEMEAMQRTISLLYCRSTLAAMQMGSFYNQMENLDLNETAQPVTEVMPS